MGTIELPRKIKDCFYRYPWPGNVRQLKAVVRRAVLSADADGFIQDLWNQWGQNRETDNSDREIDLLAGVSNLKKYLREQKNLSLKNVCGGYVMAAEITTIKKALEQTNWNRKKAAVQLSISYKSLLNKIKKYRLNC
jgi:transcriptional regulator with PAS, ATPase and Fis domain